MQFKSLFVRYNDKIDAIAKILVGVLSNKN